MIRYVQAPSLLTPIARALLSALTVREAADPSGWAITHALSLFFAMNSTVDGPSNERWDSESLAITYDVMATTRLIVYLNASFAITGNVKDRSFNLAENCNKGQRIICHQ